MSILFQAQPEFFIAVVFVLGLLIGSFLNVVIHRLPIMLEADWRSQCRDILQIEHPVTPERKFGLAWPPSRCPHCERPIRAHENIPLLSYLMLRGRCRGCSARISVRYPLVELLTGILSAAVAWRFGFGMEAAAALVVTWALIALSGIDIDHQILPDNITLPLLWLGLLVSLAALFTSPTEAIVGAAAGYMTLWTVFQLFKLLTGKEGMGYGDFKLLAVFGAWLGWQALPIVILLSSLVGAVVGIALILLAGRDRQIPIPFGPYLAAAGWLALLWRDDIIAAYLRWAGIY